MFFDIPLTFGFCFLNIQSCNIVHATSRLPGQHPVYGRMIIKVPAARLRLPRSYEYFSNRIRGVLVSNHSHVLSCSASHLDRPQHVPAGTERLLASAERTSEDSKPRSGDPQNIFSPASLLAIKRRNFAMWGGKLQGLG